jgi:2-keto-3-deoxy-L-rhamnonate aldolase RhmA
MPDAVPEQAEEAAKCTRCAPLGERGMHGFGPHTEFPHPCPPIGSTDLAQDLGVLGTPAQRQVLDEHRRRLVEAARKPSKAVAMLIDSVEGVRQMIR